MESGYNFNRSVTINAVSTAGGESGRRLLTPSRVKEKKKKNYIGNFYLHTPLKGIARDFQEKLV